MHCYGLTLRTLACCTNYRYNRALAEFGADDNHLPLFVWPCGTRFGRILRLLAYLGDDEPRYLTTLGFATALRTLRALS